jgi:hypothetical protein
MQFGKCLILALKHCRLQRRALDPVMCVKLVVSDFNPHPTDQTSCGVRLQTYNFRIRPLAVSDINP